MKIYIKGGQGGMVPAATLCRSCDAGPPGDFTRARSYSFAATLLLLALSVRKSHSASKCLQCAGPNYVKRKILINRPPRLGE